jgi:hypothetical protein
VFKTKFTINANITVENANYELFYYAYLSTNQSGTGSVGNLSKGETYRCKHSK